MVDKRLLFKYPDIQIFFLQKTESGYINPAVIGCSAGLPTACK